MVWKLHFLFYNGIRIWVIWWTLKDKTKVLLEARHNTWNTSRQFLWDLFSNTLFDLFLIFLWSLGKKIWFKIDQSHLFETKRLKMCPTKTLINSFNSLKRISWRSDLVLQNTRSTWRRRDMDAPPLRAPTPFLRLWRAGRGAADHSVLTGRMWRQRPSEWNKLNFALFFPAWTNGTAFINKLGV